MGDPSTSRVFVSYSRKDGLEFARRVQQVLEAEGLSLYRDLTHLEGGEDWWRQVETAIRSVEHFVLVLSPEALRSPYVEQEWKLARQEGKTVSPVSGLGELNFSHLPSWMARAHRHDISIPESLARLVQVLKGPARERHVPFMADALPDGFVPRPHEFSALKRLVLDARGEPVAITAALRGAGGYGKTALANALCHDHDIQEAFSDGILRVTLGERPDDLVGRMVDLLERLTGERPGFRTLDAAKSALAEALDDRRCLLVIDDAWRVQDLEPFLHRGPKDKATRLVTTRDDRILSADSVRVFVDAMRTGEAHQMLSRGMRLEPDMLRDRLSAVADRLGEWPLLLGLANGVIRARVSRGVSATEALAFVERAIDQRGIARAFAPNDRESRRQTAWGTIQISLEQLDSDASARFTELAVFVEDAEIPISTVLGLWRQTVTLDPLDGEELLARLSELSLLSELDLRRGVIRLHDVVRALLRDGPAMGRLAELDSRLVAHFRQSAGSTLARLSDSYGLRYLIAHLHGAGEIETALGLLTNPEWLSNKLERIGIQSLLEDFRNVPDCGPTLTMIAAALTLAAPALARNPKELASQVVARLTPEDAAGMREFLESAWRTLSSPALVPSRPTFTSPGIEVLQFKAHESGVTGVTVLPDGWRALLVSGDGTVGIWDLHTGTKLRNVEHQGRVTCVTVLPDGRRALSGTDDGAIGMWDLDTGAELRRFVAHEGRVTCITVLPDERRALSGAHDGTVRLWDLDTGAELWRFKHEPVLHRDVAVTCVTMLADGRRGLSASKDRTVRLWDLDTGAELRRFVHSVDSIMVLADGERALSGGDDPKLWLWDLRTGSELRRFMGHRSRVTCVTVLPDEQRVLSASRDGTVRLWDLDSGAELQRFEAQGGGATSVTVLPDGRRALSAAGDGTMQLWNLDTVAGRRRVEAHEEAVTCVTVLPDGRRALSGSRDETLRLWDLDTGAELRRFEHEGGVTCVTALRDGRRAVSAADNGTVRQWDLETGAELRRFNDSGRADCLTLLRDGRQALLRAWDGPVGLWDLDTGTELQRFDARVSISCVTVLPDGRRALLGACDGTVRMWDLDTVTEMWRGVGPSRSVTDAELRPFDDQRRITCVTALADGRRALSGASDGALRLWDLETGAELRHFDGHQRQVTCVQALAVGDRALSGANDGTLRLWDLETGGELARLTFDSAPSAIASLPDSRLVVGDSTGRVHVVHVVE